MACFTERELTTSGHIAFVLTGRVALQRKRFGWPRLRDVRGRAAPAAAEAAKFHLGRWTPDNSLRAQRNSMLLRRG